MPFQNDILAGAAGSGGESAYSIENSLLFNQNSAYGTGSAKYLSKVFASSGDRKTWTYAGWHKRGAITGETGGVYPDPVNSWLYWRGFLSQSIASQQLSSIGIENHFRGTGQANSLDGLTLDESTYSTGRGGGTTYQVRVHPIAGSRDCSGWTHYVVRYDTTQATEADRVRIYINGVLATSFRLSLTYPTLNYDGGINFGDGSATTYIGAGIAGLNGAGTLQLYDGYMAELFFIDGTSLGAASFGETDETTGQWRPKDCKDDLTFGDNGWYLNFDDATDLGNDSSGEGNDWTVTNIVANDLYIDTPQNNFCTMNPECRTDPINLPMWSGNLLLTPIYDSAPSGDGGAVQGTISVSSGKWYYECLIDTNASMDNLSIGICKTDAEIGVSDHWNFIGEVADSWGYSMLDGKLWVGGVDTATYTAAVTGDIMQVAVDMDAGKMWIGIDDTWVNSGVPASGTNAIVTSGLIGDICPAAAIYFDDPWTIDLLTGLILNFGQNSSFSGNKTKQNNQDSNNIGDFYYTPPSGFLTICTDNLPTPSIVLPGDHFNSTAYDDGAGAKTGIGFQPDLVWVKSRGSTYEHELTDSVRGVTKALSSDSTNIESTDSTGLTAFGADGFTVGADTNYSDTTTTGMVSWNWKAGGAATSNGDGSITSSVSANTTAGFSIVSYTGTGSDATVGHGLSSAPELVMVKSRDDAYNWGVWHEGLTSGDYALQLNNTIAESNTWDYWNDTVPSASVFYVGTELGSNKSTSDFIAYCFHSVEGYSKVGSYIATGYRNTLSMPFNGKFIHTGFEPAYVMIKGLHAGTVYDPTNWMLYSNKVDPVNEAIWRLQANLTDAEYEGVSFPVDLHGISMQSNGFKIRTYWLPLGGGTYDDRVYAYIAFAEAPFKYTNACRMI